MKIHTRLHPASLIATLLIASTACTSNGPSEPMGIDSLAATAVAQVVSSADMIPALNVSVSLHNRSSTQVELVVLAYCPIFVRLYDSSIGTQDPVYDGGDKPCPRAGKVLEVAPGADETLEALIRLNDLSGAGVSSGPYRVVAVVTSSPEQIEVEAGLVEIP